MSIQIEDRGYRTGWSRRRITAQGEAAYGRLQSMRPRRGFLSPRPTLWQRATVVEVYENFEHNEPAYAASFFAPTDAKAAIRELCA